MKCKTSHVDFEVRNPYSSTILWNHLTRHTVEPHTPGWLQQTSLKHLKYSTPTHSTGHWVHDSYPSLNQACNTIAVFSIGLWTTWLTPWLCGIWESDCQRKCKHEALHFNPSCSFPFSFSLQISPAFSVHTHTCIHTSALLSFLSRDPHPQSNALPPSCPHLRAHTPTPPLSGNPFRKQLSLCTHTYCPYWFHIWPSSSVNTHSLVPSGDVCKLCSLFTKSVNTLIESLVYMKISEIIMRDP